MVAVASTELSVLPTQVQPKYVEAVIQLAEKRLMLDERKQRLRTRGKDAYALARRIDPIEQDSLRLQRQRSDFAHDQRL